MSWEPNAQAACFLAREVLPKIRAELPESARFFKDRAGELRVLVHNAGKRARRVRIGIVAPDGIETSAEELAVLLPEGEEHVEFSWPCVPKRRGRYRIDACYLEGPSVLKLWKVRRRDPAVLEIRVYPNLRREEDLKALRRGVQGLHILR
jgi:uncharacterized protein (DUF58 family)